MRENIIMCHNYRNRLGLPRSTRKDASLAIIGVIVLVALLLVA